MTERGSNRSSMESQPPILADKPWYKKKKFVVSRTLALAIAAGVVVALIVIPVIVHVTADTGTTSAGDVQDPSEEDSIRLPTSLEPEHYDLELEPMLEPPFDVRGRVAVTVNVVQATNIFEFHMLDILSKNETITMKENKDGGKSIAFIRHEYDLKKQVYRGTLEESLVEGKSYVFTMEYTGYLNEKLVGFYRSVYTDENGKNKYLATTDFEPTDARLAFPCFDEPAMKATFSISVVRPRHLMTLSNMPRRETKPMDNDKEMDIFDKSVKMSTYLVAFIVSDFVSISQTWGTDNPKNFSVYARSEAIHQAPYSLDIGARTLPFFEKYFDISFPLPKQDLFAVPDFGPGAMENWGLITAREAKIMYADGVTVATDLDYLVEVVVHELAHQWFGNLVTMKWWSDLWLNEGFATYMSYVGANEVEPEWDFLNQFTVKEMHSVFYEDGLTTSHPVSVVVNSPDEIGEIFDSVSYNKGACLIGMMSNYLTEETFKKGVNNYLKEKQYSNAEQDDLWLSLTNQAHDDGTLAEELTVKAIMDTWTLKMGYPVVKVSRTTEGTGATITQERFLLTGANEGRDSVVYKWWIPLTYVTKDTKIVTTKPNQWMTPEESEVIFNEILPTSDNWVVFNVKQTGYYRVNYDDNNWKLLTNQLMENHKAIDVTNRAQIIDDSFNLARSGLIQYQTSLEISNYLSKETDYIAWYSASNVLTYLKEMYKDDNSMKIYMTQLIQPLYDSVGFEENLDEDSQLTKKTRSLALSWGCSLGFQDCLDQSVAAFQRWRESDGLETAVTPNTKKTAYCHGIAQGSTEDWNFAWNVSMETNTASERNVILSALGCSTDEEVLWNYLTAAFSPTGGVRLQDVERVFSAVARSRVGADVAWKYLEENLLDMILYTASSASVGEFVETAARDFNTDEDLAKLLALRTQYGSVLGAGGAAVDRAVSRATANLAWVSAYSDDITSTVHALLPRSALGYRLPTTFTPTHYTVFLKPFIGGDFRIDGNVTIEFSVTGDTSLLVLHMADIITKNETIKITKGSLSGEQITITGHYYMADYQYYVAEIETKMVSGETYFITMDFQGYLNDKLMGFYRSTYQDANGNDKYLAVTQMAPTDARRVFPCFDEPQLKAAFKIRLATQGGMTAASNMPVESKLADPKDATWTWFKFVETPNMSTYLVALMVSEFESRTATKITETTFGVMSRPEMIENTVYAMETGNKVLKFFNTYYGIDYPLPKQDMAAVPDFAAGAMENWGLIIYRETAMLYDAKTSSTGSQQRVGSVVAHELAHQWFGNLVTPAWWTDIWLNEGFASFMEYKGIGSVETSWGMEDQFLLGDLHKVLKIDSLRTSHPLSMEVLTTPEITATFDTISYSKGASVIRMMEAYLTEATFNKGITAYLKENEYSSATQNDLWRQLSQTAEEDGSLPEGVDVATIMSGWSLQTGYPCVTVSRTGGDTVTVRQDRFISDGSSNGADDEQTWWIPLSFTTKGSTDSPQTKPTDWLQENEASKTISIPTTTASDWLLFNIQQTGYYRVNYNDENWLALKQQLVEDMGAMGAGKEAKIHTSNRAQLLDDSMNLARAGLLSYLTSLDLASYLTAEREYVPWSAALSDFAYLESMFTRTSGYGELKEFLLSLLTPTYEEVKFDEVLGDPHLTKLLRTLVSGWTCHLGLDECVASATETFEKWMNGAVVSANLKSTTICTGLAEGGETEWNYVWAQYIDPNSVATDKAIYLSALGCTKEIWILNRYLEMAFTAGSGIRKQDIGTVFGSVAANDVGRDLAWSYLSMNWDNIVAYADAFTTLSGLVSSATAEFSTQTELDEMLVFREANAATLGSAARALDQAIEQTTANIAWLADYYEDILMAMKAYRLRLPRAIVPDKYDIKLTPDIRNTRNVEGIVTIQVHVVESTKKFVLHMADIEYEETKVKLTDSDGKELTFVSHSYDKEGQYYIGKLSESLTVGATYSFTMHFTAYLNDQMKGFYRSVYKNAVGDEVPIATTQFQPTDARRAFPCFDEPALKATFLITITHLDDMIAVSNMPIIDTVNADGKPDWKTTKFQETKIMSTYLVAFVVSDFKSTPDATTTKGIAFKVYTRPEALSTADYALEQGMKIITHFDDYFSIPYPLPKQDMFAIPDFAMGAMENWGLITYRESALLFDDAKSTSASQQRVCTVVAHELAHQWFGNLVTPAWWSDLWLNEGFATYMENKGTHHAEPLWEMLEQFVTGDLHPVLAEDSLTSSHPISVTVLDPNDINQIFDSISYSKGGSVIRMMNSFLTEESFTKGLTAYLNAHEYNSATQDDLWAALTTQAHTDNTLDQAFSVKTIMDTWTLQMGYPMVTLSRSEDGTHGNASQERFLLTGTADPADLMPYTWWVPITYRTVEPIKAGEPTTHWMTPDQEQITIEDLPSADKWVILNVDQMGYYRVNYDSKNWKLIVDQLKGDHSKIGMTNRAQLLDDSMNLARAGLLDYETSLALCEYLKKELKYVPWSSAIRNFHYVEAMFWGTPDAKQMTEYLQGVMLPAYNHVTFTENKDDPHTHKLLRASLTEFACALTHQPCMDETEKLFQAWIPDAGTSSPVSPNLKETVICNGLAQGTSENWDVVFELSRNTDLASELEVLLNSLGCSKNETVLENYLKMAFDEASGIRKQDVSRVFSSVASNPDGQDIAWSYLSENFVAMASYTQSFSTAGGFVESATYNFNTKEQLDELLEFQDKYSSILGNADRAVSRSIQRTKANIEWMQKYYDSIVQVVKPTTA